ncbi:MAG: HupE/UreJ family protein [Cyanobacteria bacterium P01_H01_bin.21]
MGQRQRAAICTAVLVVFCLIIGRPVMAHGGDVTLAELREQPQANYELRVNLPNAFANSTLLPQLPARCQLESPAGEALSSTLLLFAFTCSDSPLTNRDELVLPWQTEGTVFTVYWQDGVSKTQFLGVTENGATVPIKQFQGTDGRWLHQLRQSAFSGFTHIVVVWPHLLFLAALAFGTRCRQLVRSITFFMVGGLLSVIVVSVSGLTVPSLVAETGLIATAAALAVMGVLRKPDASTDWIRWPLLGLGLLHGCGWARALMDGGMLGTQLTLRLLVLNAGMDAAQLLAVVGSTAVGSRLPGSWRKGIGYGLVGIAVVALVLPQSYRGHTLVDSPVAQQTVSEPTIAADNAIDTDIRIAANSSTVSSPPNATSGELSTPIEVFVTIEPLEIRSEILVDVSASNLIADTPTTLTVEAQESLKQEVVQALTDNLLLEIDGTVMEPAVDQINFVVLSEEGPLIQEAPSSESWDDATLGAVLRYPTDNFPETVAVEWGQFSSTLSEIGTTINDPQSKIEAILTTSQPTIDWENNLDNVSVPAIESIDVNANSRTIPLVSLALVVFALALDSGRLRLKDKLSFPFLAATRTVLPLAIWAYPVAAVPLTLPAPLQPKPSSTQVALILDQLLGNVYESFEFRTEEEIYDKLAISVAGEQLTDIYLENRRALEVENRGGARASVDYVDVTEIGSVYSLPNKEIFVQAEWLVGGSVTHFGHTHYRNNLYVALVTLTYTDSVWKIKSIEVVDEHRLS